MGYTDLVSGFVYKDPVFRAKVDGLAENDKFLKDNGWQDSVKAVFFQASAPIGWTQNVSQNDKILRVVSGIGGGSGGSHSTSTTISLQHTAHSVPTDTDHTHVAGDHNHGYSRQSGSAGSGTLGKIGMDGSKRLRHFLETGGAGTDDSMFNRMSQLISGLVTGNGGNHNHGGATVNQQLTDISLAYVDVIICSKDSSSGYTDLTAEFDHNDKIVFERFDELADNDEFLRLRLTPFGSKMYFGQAAVPTGWTQDVTQNGKALRIVSGAGGGSGGSFDFSSTITLAHDHSTLTNQGTHTHSFPAHQHELDQHTTYFASQGLNEHIIDTGSGVSMGIGTGASAARNVVKGQTAVDGGGTVPAAGAHDHATGSSLSDVSLFYFNVVAGSKDSGGASSVYTDMTAVFTNKKLVSKQRLNKLGANDDYLNFHTVEATTIMYFFQATAPLNWTQLTSQNDKGLRIVSGAGGATAGSAGISTTITLQHSHTLASDGHTHSQFSHNHPLPVDNITALAAGTGVLRGDSSVSEMTGETPTGSAQELTSDISSNNSYTFDTYNHDHTGNTGNLLTDITLAYIDMIMCQKD